MMDKKLKWKSKYLSPPISSMNVNTLVTGGEAHDGYMYNFEPMRIRQFEIEYNKVEKSQKLATSANQKEVGGLNFETFFPEQQDWSMP